MPPPPGSDTSEALVALREARRVRAAKKGGPGGRPSQHQRERQVAHALFNWSNMGPRAQEVMDALDKWYPERDELRDPIRSTWRWLSMCARSSQDPSASNGQAERRGGRALAGRDRWRDNRVGAR